jgi:iron(III) transport system permease protein
MLMAWLFQGSREAGLLWNTFQLAAAVCAISLPLGTLVAILLSRTDLPGRKSFGLLLVALLFVPLYLQGGAWEAAFGVQGWWTLQHGGSAWLVGWRGAVWVHALAATPWVVVIVAVGLRTVEPTLEEAALLDGTALQVFWLVTLRRALPALLIAAVWVVISVAGEMTITDLFQVRTYAEELYTQAAIGEEPGQAAVRMFPAIAWLALPVILFIGLGARQTPTASGLAHLPRWVFRLGVGRWFWLFFVVCVVVTMVAVPLSGLVWKSGVVVSQTATGRVRWWSLAKCLQIAAASPMRYRAELAWTLSVSCLSATLAVLAAIGPAWWSRSSPWRGRLLLGVTALLLALPGPIVGLALVELLNRPDFPLLNWLYDRSILAPCVALWLRGLPWTILILSAAVRSVPAEMLESAAIEGAGVLAMLRSIVLPQRAMALAIAWLIAFSAAAGDLATSILVVPPGVTTLAIRIFGLLHYGVEDEVAGICLALTLAWVVAAASAARLALGRFRWTFIE